MTPDTRKVPWYLDLTPAELEECMRAFPLLLAIAKAADGEGLLTSDAEIAAERGLDALDAAHPDWRTWGEP